MNLRTPYIKRQGRFHIDCLVHFKYKFEVNFLGLAICQHSCRSSATFLTDYSVPPPTRSYLKRFGLKIILSFGSGAHAFFNTFVSINLYIYIYIYCLIGLSIYMLRFFNLCFCFTRTPRRRIPLWRRWVDSMMSNFTDCGADGNGHTEWASPFVRAPFVQIVTSSATVRACSVGDA